MRRDVTMLELMTALMCGTFSGARIDFGEVDQS